MTSRFHGAPIRPPDSPKIIKNAATPEAKERAIQLATERSDFSIRQIARILYREFQIPYAASTVGNWIRASKSTMEVQSA